MEERILLEQDICEFRAWLEEEEKSKGTVKKYLRDVRAFLAFANGRPVEKKVVMEWKEYLIAKNYAAASINSMLASLNSLFDFKGWKECRVKNLKVQRQTYIPEDKELTRPEYYRLLKAAKDKPWLKLIMETICSTGIRISELKYFTVEEVKKGSVRISNKGKIRVILIPKNLQKKLLKWIKITRIRSGVIFVGEKGEPLNRSYIWVQMKKLCGAARVNPKKVFPHNLRRLFARIFYAARQDIVKLADVLGHSSIDTTRIYIMSTGREHRRVLDRLGLVT